MNMSYCRFENTLRDLQDCAEHLNETDDLNEYERRARERLIELCKEIAADADDEGNEDADAEEIKKGYSKLASWFTGETE